MGRQRSVSLEDVRAAVAELEAEGKAAGVVAVMGRIGGSHAVVKDLLDDIRKERREKTGAALEGVVEDDQEGFPSALRPVVEGLSHAWKAMVAAERERADAVIVSTQQASDRRVFEAEKRLARVQQALEATENQLVQAITSLDSAEKRAVRAEGKVQRQAVELADLKARLDKSQSHPGKRKSRSDTTTPQEASSPELI